MFEERAAWNCYGVSEEGGGEGLGLMGVLGREGERVGWGFTRARMDLKSMGVGG